MDRIKKIKKGTLYGALKMIEQLYAENMIPKHVFNNIIRENNKCLQLDSTSYHYHTISLNKKGE